MAEAEQTYLRERAEAEARRAAEAAHPVAAKIHERLADHYKQRAKTPNEPNPPET